MSKPTTLEDFERIAGMIEVYRKQAHEGITRSIKTMFKSVDMDLVEDIANNYFGYHEFINVLDIEYIFSGPSKKEMSNIIHRKYCTKELGCKYGDKDCPVLLDK